MLFIVLCLIFTLMRIIPGDPARAMLEEDASEEEVAALREEMGLNDPLIVQFLRYMKDFIRGDWGESMYNRKPVFENIRNRMEPTILVTLYSTFLSVIFGIPFGIISARRRNTFADYTLTTMSVLGNSIPMFWLGIMCVYFFGVRLQWFPVQGYTPIAEGGIWKSLYSLTMPAAALAFGHIGGLTRYTRSMMLDVMSKDYVRTGRAKGLSENKVYYIHALKNACAPVVTNVGLSITGMLGGSTITETVFNIPGMGKLAYDSLTRRDYTQEQAIILFVAILFIFTNILLDIVYKLLDPRIELD